MTENTENTEMGPESKFKSATEYDKKTTFEERCKSSSKAIEKYEGNYPVLVYKAKHSNLNQISKFKFLVPNDLTVSQFLVVIRKRLVGVQSAHSIFFFVNKVTVDGENTTEHIVIPPAPESLGSLYTNFKSSDGYLRFIYSEENTFGNGIDL